MDFKITGFRLVFADEPVTITDRFGFIQFFQISFSSRLVSLGAEGLSQIFRKS